MVEVAAAASDQVKAQLNGALARKAVDILMFTGILRLSRRVLPSGAEQIGGNDAHDCRNYRREWTAFTSTTNAGAAWRSDRPDSRWQSQQGHMEQSAFAAKCHVVLPQDDGAV